MVDGQFWNDVELTHIDVLCGGIDRRDNSLGYTVENSRPCCMTCNFAKRKMLEEEFLARIDRVHAVHHGKARVAQSAQQ